MTLFIEENFRTPSDVKLHLLHLPTIVKNELHMWYPVNRT